MVYDEQAAVNSFLGVRTTFYKTIKRLTGNASKLHKFCLPYGMDKKQILIITNTEKPNAGLAQWVSNNEDYELFFASTDEKAIELSNQRRYDMAVIDNTDAEIKLKKLEAILPILQKEVLLVSHNGESAEDLQRKITAAFNKRKMERVKRLIVLDSSKPSANTILPPFSAN